MERRSLEGKLDMCGELDHILQGASKRTGAPRSAFPYGFPCPTIFFYYGIGSLTDWPSPLVCIEMALDKYDHHLDGLGIWSLHVVRELARVKIRGMVLGSRGVDRAIRKPSLENSNVLERQMQR